MAIFKGKNDDQGIFGRGNYFFRKTKFIGLGKISKKDK